MKPLTFDDVLIEPQYSDIKSRSEVSLVTEFLGYNLELPLISSNMDYVTGYHMAKAMIENKAFYILNRFDPIDLTVDYIDSLLMSGDYISISVGTKEGYDGVLKYLAPFGIRTVLDLTTITVDVAHGHHQSVVDLVHQLKILGFPRVVAGNVATYNGAVALIAAGADAIKVGIGPGSVCTTREVTGVGVPQLYAISEVAKAINDTASEINYRKVYLIADGGMKNSGDIVKALAAGADVVMLGSLLAGAEECPGEVRVGPDNRRWKPFRGQSIFGSNASHYAPEGIEGWVEEKGPVSDILKTLAGGMRSGFSYVGARNIKELQERVKFIEVSTGTQVESKTRIALSQQ